MLVESYIALDTLILIFTIAGNYFSFPSFEDFQFFEEDEENIDGRLDKGVL